MSDLQCPATVLLIAGESIAARGAPQSAAAGHLSGVFVASAVADDPGELAAVAAFAGARGCRLSTMPGIADGRGLARAIEDLADLHRGETIAVVGTREMIQHMLGGGGAGLDAITIAVDSAGWHLGPGADRG